VAPAVLLETYLKDQDWRALAHCSSIDPELFFSVGARESKQAKQICKGCPVRMDCLNYAMELPVSHGTWGGLTERERRRTRRTAGTAGWRSVLMPS
jgi:WhiB family transcriptional regulator, redox-sensing transcriptional regulator